MNPGDVERDERTVAVENAGYRLAYHALSFGLLGLAAYRSMALGQAAWDLLALVVLGGVLNAAYQGWHRVLYRRWVVMTIVTFVIAALVAVAILFMRGAQ